MEFYTDLRQLQYHLLRMILYQGWGRTNDAIIYGGKVNICIDGNEDDIIQLTNKLPSLNSIDYGKPFKQIFLDNNKDFYKIDGSLFSPAEVLINSKAIRKDILCWKDKFRLSRKVI